MNHYDPTPEQLAEWQAWLSGRPQVILDLAARFPPWKLFLLKDSGCRVWCKSYNEDGTITVAISGEFNAVAFERDVFGVEPNDLTECDLPVPGEKLGVASKEIAALTGRDEDEIVREMIDNHRRREAHKHN